MASPRKRARLDAPDAPPGPPRFASSYTTYVRDALYASAFRSTGLSLGSRIQVLWSVQRITDGDADGDAEPEPEEEDVWWSCVVEAEVFHGPDGRPAHRVRYDPSDELGFDEETRAVAFLRRADGTPALLDLHDGEPMPWRLEDGEDGEEGEEGEEEAELAAACAVHPPGVLPPGTKVKARFQGGERAYAGEVHAVRYGQSGAEGPGGDAHSVLYDILYEDRVLEEGVPADLVERATVHAHSPASTSPRAGAGGAPACDEEIAATSIEGFFSKFVAALMHGKAFSGLSAARKAAFAECVQRSRPHFEAELHNLASDRGYGTTVTAEDITQFILPRVLPQVVSEFKALATS